MSYIPFPSSYLRGYDINFIFPPLIYQFPLLGRNLTFGFRAADSKEEPALTMAPEAKDSWIHRARSNPHVKGGNISVLGSHFVAASGEFVGTFFFLWLGYGGQLMALTQAAAPAGTGGGASSETVVFIALIYSFSLLVNAWAFYRISGGLFNPAVSFAPRG